MDNSSGYELEVYHLSVNLIILTPMKIKSIILFTFFSCVSVSQAPTNIKVNINKSGTSEKSELSLFHLNHVLYIKAFVLSNIYSSVTAVEMAFISNSLLKNLNEGKRIQFIISTGQKVDYRLALFTAKNKGLEMLVILTNFNPQKGVFEKKMKDDHYAATADISGKVVLGNMFELPLSDEEKYEKEKDYLSLINMKIFNTEVDTSEINKLFALSAKTQTDVNNNTNWLKS
ncbi:MAG: hypothetical protein ACI857_003051, partial [Arenicella sp.]